MFAAAQVVSPERKVDQVICIDAPVESTHQAFAEFDFVVGAFFKNHTKPLIAGDAIFGLRKLFSNSL